MSLLSIIPNSPIDLDNNLTTFTSVNTNLNSSPFKSLPNLIDISGQNLSQYSAFAINLNNLNGTTDSSQLPSATSNDVSTTESSTLVDFSQILGIPNNPLNDYSNYTYHLRWFATNDIDSYSIDGNSDPSTVDNLNKMIIAESGVTAGFNITDFSIHTVCGPNITTNNMPATKWSMTVVEPYGISLVDRIRSGTQQLGTANHMTSPYFIDLWFTGFNPDGSYINDNVIGQKTNYHLWRMIITQITSKTTEGGTTWSIEGVVDGELANSNQNSTVGGSSTIKTGNTFGDFLDNLTKTFNLQEEAANVQADKTLVKYKIIAPDEVRAWDISGLKPSESSQRNSDYDLKDLKKKEIKLNKGQDIGSVINYVASMNETAINWIQGKNSDGSQKTSGPNLQDHGLIKVFMIHSSIKVVGWDTWTNDYIKEVTYTLTPYISAKANVDEAQIRSSQQPDVQTAKVKQIVGNRKLRRAYNYVYTGRNTEVIKFDIAINTFWQVAINGYNNQNSYSQQTQGPVASKNSIGYVTGKGYNSKLGAQQRAKLSVDQTQLDTLKKNNAGEDQINKQQQLVDADTTALRQTTLAEHKLSYFYPEDINKNGGSVVNNLLAAVKDSSSKNILQNEIKYYNSRQQKIANNFAEDFGLYQSTSSNPFAVAVTVKKEPSAANAEQNVESPKTPATSSGNGSNSASTRGLIGAVFGNINNNESGEFVSISLEIRGDPYWLGPGNVREKYLVETNSGVVDKTKMEDSALYITGDEFIVMSFRSGQAPDEYTGIMDLNSGTTSAFQGIYYVTEVQSEFKGGQFTQTLTACLDLNSQSIGDQVATAAANNNSTPPTATNNTKNNTNTGKGAVYNQPSTRAVVTKVKTNINNGKGGA